MRLLLNADVGEGMQADAQLIPYLDQASIACGGHAGDEQSMKETIVLCIEHHVQIGAHPSYMDRVNFGRVSKKNSYQEITQLVRQQTHNLQSLCEQQGAVVSYIKPHGALYNDMMSNENIYMAVLDGVANSSFSSKLMIAALPQARQAGRCYQQLAKQSGVEIIQEVFADRAYLSSGLLCSRTKIGAVFDSPEAVVQQAETLAAGYVDSIEGDRVPLSADSLCLHGDNPVVLQAVAEVAAMLNN